MEAAENRMKLADPGDRHRGSDRVEHAAMAAGRDNDQAAPSHDIASSMLIGMAVRDQAAASLLFGEVIGRRRLDERVGQYPLEGVTRYMAGSKRPLQCMCRFAAHGFNTHCLQRCAVERSPGKRLFIARADPFFAK